jgi:hypothetical protein
VKEALALIDVRLIDHFLGGLVFVTTEDNLPEI